MAVDFRLKRSNNAQTKGSDANTARLEWTAYPAQSSDEVFLSANMPVQINSVWPDNPSSLLRCRSISIRRMDQSSMWLVIADWSVPRNGNTHNESSDPLNDAAQIRWANIVNGEPIDRDIEGNAIINSSGTAFANPPQRDYNSKQLEISYNFPSFNLDAAMAFENTVNSDVFQGGQPGEVRCLAILPTSVYTLNSQFINVAFEFEFRAIEVWGNDPHQLRILDQGFTAFASVDGSVEEVALCDRQGQILSEPARLNGQGAPLSSSLTYLDSSDTSVDSPVWANISPPSGATLETTTSGVFLRYNRYPAKAFAGLGI